MKIINILILLTLLANALFSENFNFSSDKTSISLAKGSEQTSLSGHAQIISDNITIRADYIELFGDDFQYARCRGNIIVIDKNQGIQIETEKLFYDRKAEIMTINSYAEMIDQKNEIVVKGSYFKNRGKDNITIIQIGVRIFKADENDSMICRSEFAKYNRDNETLELAGSPIVIWKDDEYRASRITIDLDTDNINMTGEVSGTIKSDTEKSVDESVPIKHEEKIVE